MRGDVSDGLSFRSSSTEEGLEIDNPAFLVSSISSSPQNNDEKILENDISVIIIPHLIITDDDNVMVKEEKEQKMGQIIDDKRLSVDSKNLGKTKMEVKASNAKVKKELKGCKRYLGLALGILSSLIFSLATLGVKLLNHYHPVTVCLWRFYGIFIPSGLIILYTEVIQGRPVLRSIFSGMRQKLKLFSFLFLRACSGCGSYIFFNYSMHYMSLPDATVITFSTPVFVTFLARIFLGEHCGLMNVLAAIVTLIGVAVIIRPPFLTGEAEVDTTLLTGAGMAFGAMTLLCIVYLCLRVDVVKTVNYSVVTLSFGLLGAILCSIVAVSIGQLGLPQTGWDWCLAVSMSVATFSGQVCATIASKYEEAGIVALTRTFDVIFAFIWQFIFLGVTPTVFSLIGSLIVISGIVLIIVQKYLQHLPADKKCVTKKYFSFLPHQ